MFYGGNFWNKVNISVYIFIYEIERWVYLRGDNVWYYGVII